MAAERIPVTFDVNGHTYTGDVERMNIIHQALEHILPGEHLRARRLTVRRADGTLIYPDMFVGEIFDHYGDVRLNVEVIPLREEAGEWTNFGFDHLALATNARHRARDFSTKA